MEREEVMRRIKMEIDTPGIKDGLKKNKAAMLLGVSRQRVTQLYAAWKKKGAPPMKDPTPPPDTAPVPTPGDINAVLSPINGGAPPPPAAPPTPPPTSAPPPDTTKIPPPVTEQVDPEDAAAGRDLVKWFVQGFKVGLAKWVFKIKKDDPRMSEIREENEFLKISIRRNSEKAAPLGKLTKGPWGLFIGSCIEAVKMAFIIEDAPPAPSDIPATPFKEVKKDLTTYSDPAPMSDAPARKMTTDEKIAAALKAKL